MSEDDGTNDAGMESPVSLYTVRTGTNIVTELSFTIMSWDDYKLIPSWEVTAELRISDFCT